MQAALMPWGLQSGVPEMETRYKGMKKFVADIWSDMYILTF